ncbi:MAG: indolepyruvate ferredoxin oxidoreductase subunit alpha [Anaerolineales bacterium]|nr:MAG: indolepyruvate ferredoxin oxidoreductase subunit alpha [Anaerolineales bacterium]
MKLMSGNEAIARGAWEAGVVFAAGYPGTPSTEVLEHLAQCDEVRAQWSVNEKVAFDEGVGAALGGLRTMVTMKHMGLNVASDAFMALPYSGVNAGFVVLVADDPNMHSSVHEEDTRFFARMAKMPMVEPSDPQEAKDLVGVAFELSERFRTPVMYHSTTRIAHTKGLVELGERREMPQIPYEINAPQFSTGIYRHRLRLEVEARLEQLRKYAEEFPLNRIEEGKGSPQPFDKLRTQSLPIGVITSGISYQYVREVLPEATIFKLTMIYPLPLRKLKAFCREFEKVYVIEEGEGFLEEQIAAAGVTNLVGKALFGTIGEYNPQRLETAIKGTQFPTDFGQEIAIPPRYPMFCTGCLHRTVYHALRDLNAMVAGDIGCYTMGALPPFGMVHVNYCMGSSVGNAYGFQQAGVERAVAVIGDSTFIHAGIPGLIDAVYNGGKNTIVILDNSTTGMTGQQVHAGTGVTLKGEPTVKFDFATLARAVGVRHVAEVDAWQMLEVKRAFKEAMQYDGVAVVVVHGPCQQLPEMKEREIVPYLVDREACYGCDLCLALYCPAILKGEEGKPRILEWECVACGICAQICPVEAIYQQEIAPAECPEA